MSFHASVSCTLLCLVLIPLAGCAHKGAGIVGRWHGTTTSNSRGSVDTDAEFRPDHTAVFTVHYAGVTLAESGRFAMTGDTLRYTPQGGTLNGRAIPLAPGQALPVETSRVTLAGDDLTLERREGARTVTTLKRVP